jgi:twinkle protein
MGSAEKGLEALNQAAALRPVAVSPMDLRAELEHLWDAGLPPGDQTGWPSLDQLYSVVPGQLTVVTGWPSSGKSEWLDALLVNLARRGWCFAVFSPENQPVAFHASKMLEKISGKPFGRGPTERMTRDELGEHLDILDHSFRFIEAPADAALSPRKVLDAAEPWLLGQGKRGLVIDPWNELEHWRPSHLSETEYVSQTLSMIRGWARKNRAHVWVVAHPQKMRAPDGKLPVPRPDMISGSQNWWNKADNSITIWRDLELQVPEVVVHVQKIRFKHVGRAGQVTMRWDRATGRYFDVAKPVDVARYAAKAFGDE